MRCPNCGRETVDTNGKAVRCTNPQCPALRWPAARRRLARVRLASGNDEINLVELTPAIERNRDTRFVGTLYVKEVRVIEGCRCQGVSLSTVAAGENKNEVRDRTFAAARTRAELYRNRGYEVMMNKLAA